MTDNPDKKYKSSQVAELFDSIAYTYDFLNHFLSGGIDFYWRRKALELIGNPPPKIVLDVACGTGDFAIAAAKSGSEEISGIDIAEKMLILGRSKVEQKKLAGKINLVLGHAESIQFSDDHFDAAISAFGVRNFENLNTGLSEMRRVLKKDAKICILEFSKPKMFPLKQLYFAYFRLILPIVGKIISKNKIAYSYLPDTVMKFPEGKDFLNILERIGFKQTKQYRLTFGIATVYIGIKS